MQFSQKDAKTVLKKLKTKFWGSLTIPHFFGSLGVPEYEKNGKHALFVANFFCRPHQYLIFDAISIRCFEGFFDTLKISFTAIKMLLLYSNII